MVYNTTDIRSSLSITDLSSDGDYSVTVAGRDGAGRLGKESEEFKLNCKYNISAYDIRYYLYIITVSKKMEQVVTLDYGFVLDMNKGCGIHFHWNVIN